MKEFLELTEQSQKLQIQFQQVGDLRGPSCDGLLLYSDVLIFMCLFTGVKSQLQAGETLRNTSHSSTAADLFQARQQLSLYQQQVDEMNAELHTHQESSREQLENVKQLQNKLTEMETVRGCSVFTNRMCVSFFLVLIVSCFLCFCVGGKKSRRIFQARHQ